MSDMMTQEEAMNMSNEQAVQILIPMRNMMCDQNGCPISDAVFALDKAIEALSADRPQAKWIPCSERLPNKDGHYLVCVDWSQDNVDVLRWADGWNCFRDFDGNVYRKSELDRDTVIAWMPLPSAYKGE